MNRIEGTVDRIETNGELSLVTVSSGGLVFSAIVMDSPETASWLGAGKTVHLMFKETEVVIAVEQNPVISLRNRIPGVIRHMESGKLLCRLQMDTVVGDITSIITARSAAELDLNIGSNVIAMIKTNEMMLVD